VVETPCPECSGSGLTLQRKRYRVNVPAGVKDGTRIRLAGKGEDGPLGGPPGDLFVTTRVAPSPVFKRRADGNLEVRVPVTVSEAIEGATVEVPVLRGTKRIRISPGTQHGTMQRLRGEGPPKPGGSKRGDILYRVEVEVPRDLTAEQKRALGEFAKTLADHDPRAELLRSARGRAATDRSEDEGKVGTK
jgi:molecular chaperone DnaJ